MGSKRHGPAPSGRAAAPGIGPCAIMRLFARGAACAAHGRGEDALIVGLAGC